MHVINSKFLSGLLVMILVLANISMHAQDEDKPMYCVLNCDANIHIENKNLVYSYLDSDSIKQVAETLPVLDFPIRFAFVTEDTTSLNYPDQTFLAGVIENLNHAYANTGVKFSIAELAKIQSEIKLEELSANAFQLYDNFSFQHDRQDIITVYILDYARDFCRTTATSISCSRVGGFSYVLSGLTNNLVLSQFDLKNPIIVAHEFGHFFGLYHTFEEHLFGKGSFDSDECHRTGDLICDTPPDPGTAFEIHVNYATCEMIGFEDNNGNTYQPLINNYMAYYKPCYLKEFQFTQQQELVVRLASNLQMRKKFSRQ